MYIDIDEGISEKCDEDQRKIRVAKDKIKAILGCRKLDPVFAHPRQIMKNM